MTVKEFQEQIKAGIPDVLPAPKPYDPTINHAPKRKEILTEEERVLAIRNALRYFPAKHHEVLAREFAEELHKYGRIYMYRFRPDYEMYARPIEEYPHKSRQAAAIMVMIQNNLDKAVAQHPHELITYGGNGAVFQNWAQYLLTMQYLSQMTDDQTLVMYSGHPMGLFPSHPDAPRVIVTNGMVIPNYSKPDDWERFNALGVSQYGQMTAGSYMYIGPQGIVHGTTITVLNAARKRLTEGKKDIRGMLFVTAGLGGMSGAQPKAGNISGVVSITAEINPKAVHTRYSQGWVDEVYTSLDELLARAKKAQENKEAVSLAYQGNVVDLWERLAAENVNVDLGSDQTSLHNPWAGGYYPVGLSYEESNRMMAEDPEEFKKRVQESLRRQVAAINKLTAKGMYFFGLRQCLPVGVFACRCRHHGRGRSFPLSFLCAGYHGPDVLRLRLRSLPLGMYVGQTRRPGYYGPSGYRSARRDPQDRSEGDRRTARRQYPLDQGGRQEQAGRRFAGAYPVCRQRGPHQDRARVQRRYRTR